MAHFALTMHGVVLCVRARATVTRRKDGRPRRVPIDHRSLLASACAHGHALVLYLSMTGDSVVLQQAWPNLALPCRA